MTENPVRLDRWLWAARFFKTRVLAAAAVAGGKVHVNGTRAKPAKQLQVGDALRIRVGPYEWLVSVQELSQRRGPPRDAQELYNESVVGRAARERLPGQPQKTPAPPHQGQGPAAKKESPHPPR